MNIRSRLIAANPRSALWAIVPLCLSPLSLAHAYLDPNTGSYIIQIAIGIIFGTFYAFKNFFARLITKIREFLAKRRRK